MSYLLYAIANVATTGVLIYLFKYILDNTAAYSIVGVIPVITGLVSRLRLHPILQQAHSAPLPVLGWHGAQGSSATCCSPSAPAIWRMVIVGLVFFYLPQTFIQMTAILSLTDSIEYGQLKNGKRNEAVTLSVRPMLDKIAGACSNGIVGFIAVAAGMIGDATAADMTAANIGMFKVCAFYVPLGIIVLSLLVFLFKVKITEKMHDEIVEELEAKLASGEISE